MILDKEFLDTTLEENKFSLCEITMIKSLKKGETSRIEILPHFLSKNLNNLLGKFGLKYDNKSRIIYEIELINFKELIEKETNKGKKYQCVTLSKGI
jgi:hypothetical protein